MSDAGIDGMEHKTLEQLAQKLRKSLPKTIEPFLEELVRRVSVSYLEFIDSHTEVQTGDSHVAVEGWREARRRLCRTIEELKQSLETKNTELDALAYVWCTGSCTGGQFRYTEPREITSEMIKRVVAVALRLYSRGANTASIDARIRDWQTARMARAFSRITKVGEQRIDYLSKMVDSFRESTNIVDHVEKLEVVTYMKNNNEIFPNVSGMLAELLAKGIIVVNPFNRLCLQCDDLFGHAVHPIEISDIESLHEASSKPGGLWVWAIEHRVSEYKPCGYVVGELKKLGLWKPEWNNLK